MNFIRNLLGSTAFADAKVADLSHTLTADDSIFDEERDPAILEQQHTDGFNCESAVLFELPTMLLRSGI